MPPTDTEIRGTKKGDRAHQHSTKYNTKVEVRQHSTEEEAGHTGTEQQRPHHEVSRTGSLCCLPRENSWCVHIYFYQIP